MLNRVKEEPLSMPDIAKAEDIELQEIMENAARRTEDLIAQFSDPLGDLLDHPLHELLGLNKVRAKEHSGLTQGRDGEEGSVGRTHREGKA